jgi:hypothetical protein
MTSRSLLLLTLAVFAVILSANGSNNIRRRLQDGRPKITREEAEKACANHGDEKEACIFDVMVSAVG